MLNNENVFMQDITGIAHSISSWENVANSSFLVTGATGLVGSLILKALLMIKESHNLKLIGLCRSIEKAGNIFQSDMSHIEWIQGDITKELTYAEEIDYVIHCASVTNSKMMVNQPVETIMTAIIGTRNILELAKEKNCKSVVYVSSMEMYGTFNDLNGEVQEEDIGYIDPLKIRSNYPESKRLCENMCIAYQAEYKVPVKIARLAQTFGAGILPGENRVFAQFARSAINGTDIILHTKGLSEGNYCYTRDAIIGIFTILFKGENGQAYNVSNPDTHTTIADMAKMVAENIAEGKINVIFDIPESNVFGYAADTKMKLNSDKLQALGWRPEVGLEDAYRRLISYMKEM